MSTNYAVTFDGSVANLENVIVPIAEKITLGSYDESGRIFLNESITDAKTIGNDFIINTANRQIRITDGRNKKIAVLQDSGDVTYYGNYLTVTNESPASVMAGRGVETIDATDRNSNVYLKGNAASNTIFGSQGDNTIAGGAGADYIVGGIGDNLLIGGSGADTLFGGTGDNTIRGGAGADYIVGGEGDNLLYGEVGNDIILGGSGNNTLNGGAGADTLIGGGNADTMTGGMGADVFVYSGGNVLITDYRTEDRIFMSENLTDTIYSGKDVIFEIGEGTLTVKGGADKELFIDDNFFISELGNLDALSNTANSINIFSAENFNHFSSEV